MKKLSTGSEYRCGGVRVLAAEARCSVLQLDCTLDTRKQAICFIKCTEGPAAWEQSHTQEMLGKKAPLEGHSVNDAVALSSPPCNFLLEARGVGSEGY